MKRELAEEIIRNALAFFEPTNVLFRSVKQIEDENIKNDIMIEVELLTKHSTKLIFKVISKYPDLNPFK